MESLTEIEQLAAGRMTRDDAIRALENKDERARRIAMAALENQGESVGDVILERLRLESAKRKKKQRVLKWIIGGYSVMLALFVGVWVALGISTGRWSEFPWQAFQVLNFVGIFAGGSAATQFQKSATEIIARFDDVRYIPPLVEALGYNDKNMLEIARRALTTLLPRLTAADAGKLEEGHRHVLQKWLLDRRYPEFARAILRALEQVGDERDLPSIQKLAQREAATLTEIEVKQAALGCLPYVQQRADLNRAANSLLRPSSSADEDGSLLRPAESLPNSAVDVLLRPAPGQDTAGSVPMVESDSESTDIQRLESTSSNA